MLIDLGYAVTRNKRKFHNAQCPHCQKVILQTPARILTRRSCGCIHSGFKHGAAARGLELKEYGVHRAMLQRCYNPNANGYEDYGGRGITVCERWRESFENFFADMGARPSDKHSLDRVDNSRGYEPDNCRWTTRHTQSRNHRRNVYVEIGNIRDCVMDWLTMLDLPRRTYFRYVSQGLSPTDAIMKIVRREHAKNSAT